VSSLLRPPATRVEPVSSRIPAEISRLVDDDPIVNAVVGARLRSAGSVEPRRLGGTLLAARDADGRLTGAAFSGGNLLPVGGGPEEWRAIGLHLAEFQRGCSSIVGPAAAVQALWDVLSRAWDEPRSIRAAQPLLLLDSGGALPPGDRRVRAIRPSEVDRYVPAAAAMFTEELGISPYELTGAPDYRRRVAALVNAGRAFGIVDADGQVIFKADLGAVSPRTCQVQGVWVRPDLRGCGLGGAGLAEVLRHALTLAPTVSLYVNDFNVPARRVYARLGMRQVATLSTILF
jgi:RimJ/RimL family protein N-acetyltransferase